MVGITNRASKVVWAGNDAYKEAQRSLRSHIPGAAPCLTKKAQERRQEPDFGKHNPLPSLGFLRRAK